MVELIDPGPIEFEAVLQGEGGGTWVDVPLDLKQTYGKGNLAPIVATFNRAVPYRGILAMMGGYCPMLLVRSDVRGQLRAQVGDQLRVRLELDTAPQIVELSDDVTSLVTANADAQIGWESSSPGHTKEYVRWIEEAKRPETRQRRVDETVARLSRGEKMRT